MKTSKLTIILALIFVLFAATEILKEKRDMNSPKNPQKIESIKVSSIINNIGESLKLENWITSDKQSLNRQNGYFKPESDKPLHLESWMTDVLAWEFAALLPVENEKPLLLETWMKNASYWEKEIIKYAHVSEMN